MAHFKMFSKCYAFTVHAANLTPGTRWSQLLPALAKMAGQVLVGRYAFLFFSGSAMGHHHWHQCPIAFGGFILMAIFLCYEYYCMHWAMCTNHSKLIARLLSLKKSLLCVLPLIPKC